jgi:hypothetical protein
MKKYYIDSRRREIAYIQQKEEMCGNIPPPAERPF